jgi:alpha-maltose-1-phosphate synthase
VSVSAAIDFVPEAFVRDPSAPMGRQAAGEGFLAAWARATGVKRLVGHVRSAPDGEAFVRQIAALAPRRPAVWASPADLRFVVEEGALFSFRPELQEHAWRRRATHPGAYCLCGLTHTLSSHLAQEAVTGLLTAPVEPWDALICTSRSIRDVVERLWDAQEEYLRERFDAKIRSRPKLEVIPLGVDVEHFAASSQDKQRWRRHFGLAPDDITVIYMGRLSIHAKANPLPMYMALERAARAAKKRVQLLLVGWLANSGQADIFREAAARLAPSITVKLVDGRVEQLRQGAFAAADVFFQLADNIQESFGLAPVEAMAAGLPAVVSDWNGFRDTIEDGVHGFRVASLTPSPGAGEDLARRYDEAAFNYDTYVGAVSQFTAVDVEHAAEALAKLFGSADLRRRMGLAARRRAVDEFSWDKVIVRYQALWRELDDLRRRSASDGTVLGRLRPDRPDPFYAFAGFSTRRLLGEDLVTLVSSNWADEARRPGVAVVPGVLPYPAQLEALLRRLEEGPATLAELLSAPDLGVGSNGRVIAWLAKFGAVRVTPGGEP